MDCACVSQCVSVGTDYRIWAEQVDCACVSVGTDYRIWAEQVDCACVSVGIDYKVRSFLTPFAEANRAS